uniref:Uncharacterized protein n=1 Tax=Kalanchoe fedtschenkoi TaxID=63787 RepID=A0A7N0RJE3_KALFE
MFFLQQVLQRIMNNSYSFVDEVRSLPDYNDFDPYEDFCQFLEEAKQHAEEADLRTAEPEKEQLAADTRQVKDKIRKKSWKASTMFSWLKVGKPRAQPSTGSQVLKPLKVSASGPICGRDERRDYVKPKLQLSGKLNSLFTPLKKSDTQMQYMSLEKPNIKHSIQSYSPIYAVK